MNIYSWYLPQHIVDLTRRLIPTHGTSQVGRHKYTVPGTRKSGVPDTSLGNSIITAYLFFQLYLEKRKPMRVIVMGDDCVMVAPEDAYTLLDVEHVYTRGGFVPKARLLRDVEDVGFLSGYLVPIGEGYHWTITLGRFLTRYFWYLGDIGPKNHEQVNAERRLLAVSIKPLVRCLPVAAELVERILSGAAPKRSPHSLERENWKPTGVGVPYGEPARVWFCRRYSVSMADLDGLLAQIRQLDTTKLQVHLNHPVLNRVVEIDLGGED